MAVVAPFALAAVPAEKSHSATAPHPNPDSMPTLPEESELVQHLMMQNAELGATIRMMGGHVGQDIPPPMYDGVSRIL